MEMKNEDTGARSEFEYVGFWARVGASLLDTLLLMMVLVPLTYMLFGTVEPTGSKDILINWIIPGVIVIALWIRYGATPGKMAMGARIVDATTGKEPTTQQFLIRYLGYFVGLIPLGVGIFWVAFDRKKQGWHDKMAHTVVVKPAGKEPVKFEDTGPIGQQRPDMRN